MPQDSWIEEDDDGYGADFVEIDPTGRYGRYKEILGRGAFKKVYRAFDELEGMEVAWNQIKVADLLHNPEDREHLHSEIHLLKTLKHKNIIKCYHSWADAKNEHINFITELFTSGTLRQYRKKHKHVDLRALKKWSRQILEGLSYLHSHNPPVIHRDLKCDNLFINGNQGEVKIGDLGLAAILQQAHSAHSVIGTPEFMAPELYEEEYNELVDIYAFGMCLLELVTFEYPYVECSNAAQIFKKVTSGIKPASLVKVENPGVRIFIEKCIAKASERLSAKQLLEDPFLESDGEVESVGHSLDSRTQSADPSNTSNTGKNSTAESGLDLTVEGQRKDINKIFLKLRIADSSGHLRNIHFPFDTETDTSISVATEMVEELDLTDQDVSTIADMIDSEIQSHFPDWATEGNKTGGIHGNADDSCDEENKSPVQTNKHNLTDETNSFSLERLPSGRKYWSSTQAVVENRPPTHLSKLALRVDAISVEEGLSRHDGHSEDGCNHLNGRALEAKPEDESACQGDGDGLKDKKNDGNDDSSTTVTRMESEIKKIVRELEQLLARHQEEREELVRRHEVAVSELLKELPPDIRQRVLRDCQSKITSDSSLSDEIKS